MSNEFLISKMYEKLDVLLPFSKRNPIVLTENVSYDRLNAILINPDFFSDNDLINEFPLRNTISKYLSFKNKNMSGLVTVHYFEKNPLGIGRLSPHSIDNSWFSNSSMFKKKARNLLYFDNGIDIDIVNCHVVIIRYFLSFLNLPHSQIDYYINNRKSILDNLIEITNCPYDYAKQLALRLCYGGTIDGWLKDFPSTSTSKPSSLSDFWYRFQSEISALNPVFHHLLIWKSIPNDPSFSLDDNLKTKFSLIIQHFEKLLLLIMISVAKKLHIDILCLCFDGFILSKYSFNSDFISICTSEINSSYPGLNISLVIKPIPDLNIHCPSTISFDTVFMNNLSHINLINDSELSDLQTLLQQKLIIFNSFNRGIQKQQSKTEITDLKSKINSFELIKQRIYYNYYKSYFEQFHGKIRNPFSYYEKSHDSLPITYDKSTFENLVCNVTINNVPFTKIWFSDIHILTFDKFDFLPPPLFSPINILNFFTGLRAEKLNRISDLSSYIAGLSLIKNHLSLLCNHDPIISSYVTNFLAQLVQFPGSLIGIALVFKSIQGIGKNIFFDFIGSIIGKQYYILTDKMDQITGRFSSIQNKLLVIIDEVNGKDSFNNSNHLKSLIASKECSTEQKFKPVITTNNTVRCIFLTNNDIPIKIEQSDRRYFVIDNLLTIPPNKSYFDILLPFLDNDLYVRAFYDYLINIDLSSWNPKDRPVTQSYTDIQNASRPIICEFIELHILDYSSLSIDDFYISNNLIYVKSKSLLDLYNSYLISINFSPITFSKLRIEIKHVPSFIDYSRPDNINRMMFNLPLPNVCLC